MSVPVAQTAEHDAHSAKVRGLISRECKSLKTKASAKYIYIYKCKLIVIPGEGFAFPAGSEYGGPCSAQLSVLPQPVCWGQLEVGLLL